MKGTTQIAKVTYDIYPYKIVRNYYGNSATVQKTEECDNDGVKKTVDEVTDANGVVSKETYSPNFRLYVYSNCLSEYDI
jgi:hypothetical protein